MKNKWKEEKTQYSVKLFEMQLENDRLKRMTGSPIMRIEGNARSDLPLLDLYRPAAEQIRELQMQLEKKNQLILELSVLNKAELGA
jgi:hypothetical protein